MSDQRAGQVAVRSTSGLTLFILDGNLGLVSGAADMAELFPAAGPETPQGSVMAIDPEHPGALRVADRPHDHRVAGVVAGARDFRPGITLGASRRGPSTVSVTLSGTVYCLATSSNGPIRAGDLLTTSAEPGTRCVSRTRRRLAAPFSARRWTTSTASAAW